MNEKKSENQTKKKIIIRFMPENYVRKKEVINKMIQLIINKTIDI